MGDVGRRRLPGLRGLGSAALAAPPPAAPPVASLLVAALFAADDVQAQTLSNSSALLHRTEIEEGRARVRARTRWAAFADG